MLVMVRLLLAKESEFRFFRRHCEGFLSEKRIGVGLSPWVFGSFLPSKKNNKRTFTLIEP
jgi:hypothetical protein